MGRFSDIHIDIVEMFSRDGMSEEEIAKSVGIPLIDVHTVLAEYESSVNQNDYSSLDDFEE
jgi:hypothetical protein